MDRIIRILFIRPSKSSFVQRDLELLRKHFDIRVVDFVLSKKDLKGTLAIVFGMVKRVIWADSTFSWFAGTENVQEDFGYGCYDYSADESINKGGENEI